jgi:hypothetical protein
VIAAIITKADYLEYGNKFYLEGYKWGKNECPSRADVRNPFGRKFVQENFDSGTKIITDNLSA